ncbi:MAG: hypothetical protein ABIO40_07980 [Devosia sp.]
MATKIFDTDKFEAPTGKSWSQWLEFAKKAKLADLPHNEIAIRFSEAGVPNWWSQMLTVAYEQHIGRRAPGQVGDAFRTQVNRTILGEVPAVHDRWIKAKAKVKEFGGVALAKAPTISTTPKRSYWRVGLVDGGKVQVAFEPRPGKTMINVTHEKLDSAASIERWKAIWKKVLSDFS